MFGSETDRKNDRYGWIDAAAPELLRASRELVENNEAGRVSDEAVAQILTAAIRLYVAKSDGEERTFPPIAGEQDKYSAVQQIDVHTDTRDILAHARRNALKRGLQDWFVCDIDAHHVETVSWKEIVTYIEDPVVRDNAMRFQAERLGAPPYGLNGDLGLRYQSVGGRIPHQDGQREIVEETDVHRDVVLTRRAMDSLGVDNMVVFPTPMLFLGMHPQPEWKCGLAAPIIAG